MSRAPRGTLWSPERDDVIRRLYPSPADAPTDDVVKAINQFPGSTVRPEHLYVRAQKLKVRRSLEFMAASREAAGLKQKARRSQSGKQPSKPSRPPAATGPVPKEKPADPVSTTGEKSPTPPVPYAGTTAVSRAIRAGKAWSMLSGRVK